MVLKNGLSRMRGDPHVRFLGGGGAAMRRRYPTKCMELMGKGLWLFASGFGAARF